MDYQTDVGKPISELGILKNLENRIQKPITITVSKGEKEKRKYIITEIERLVAWDSKDGQFPLWRQFQFPIRIPTDWLEGWKDGLILFYGNKWAKKCELFRLIKESKK